MSAFDRCGHDAVDAYSRLVPGPDVSRCSKFRALLDGLVGGNLHDQGYRQPERLGGRQIDDQIEFGWLLNGDVGRRSF